MHGIFPDPEHCALSANLRWNESIEPCDAQLRTIEDTSCREEDLQARARRRLNYYQFPVYQFSVVLPNIQKQQIDDGQRDNLTRSATEFH